MVRFWYLWYLYSKPLWHCHQRSEKGGSRAADNWQRRNGCVLQSTQPGHPTAQPAGGEGETVLTFGSVVMKLFIASDVVTVMLRNISTGIRLTGPIASFVSTKFGYIGDDQSFKSILDSLWDDDIGKCVIATTWYVIDMIDISTPWNKRNIKLSHVDSLVSQSIIIRDFWEPLQMTTKIILCYAMLCC